ncbi:hypothetical protein ARMGADRAFT_685973 [Armillaria gallica]|uniref:Secreted protein n=1 Tax=Armillaria gallica TaxID=47427 RepID=A0A2H3D3A6_ARMGA|nr:hypothetical protein ARMGADRAFT_685973 [Armillaria gallica]
MMYYYCRLDVCVCVCGQCPFLLLLLLDLPACEAEYKYWEHILILKADFGAEKLSTQDSDMPHDGPSLHHLPGTLASSVTLAYMPHLIQSQRNCIN